jgi:hypothetical protein
MFIDVPRQILASKLCKLLDESSFEGTDSLLMSWVSYLQKGQQPISEMKARYFRHSCVAGDAVLRSGSPVSDRDRHDWRLDRNMRRGLGYESDN